MDLHHRMTGLQSVALLSWLSTHLAKNALKNGGRGLNRTIATTLIGSLFYH